MGERLRASGSAEVSGQEIPTARSNCRTLFKHILEKRPPRGADLGGKNLQDLEGQHGVRLHERDELGAREKADPRPGQPNRRERVGLVANEAGKTEERTAFGLNGEDRRAPVRGHAERGFAFVKDEEARGGIVLVKQDAVGVADNRRGVLAERANQLRIGEKRSGIKRHKEAFPGESQATSAISAGSS